MVERSLREEQKSACQDLLSSVSQDKDFASSNFDRSLLLPLDLEQEARPLMARQVTFETPGAAKSHPNNHHDLQASPLDD